MLRLLTGQGIPGEAPAASFAGPGDPPAYFNKSEQALWQTIVGRVPRGLLTPADAGMCEMLVVHTLRWRRTNAAIRRCGLLQRDGDRRGGPQRISALVKLARAEAVLIAQLSSALGLTAVSRSGIYLPPERTEPLSELERLMSGPGLDGYLPRSS
jgi:phage terminase small subunit